MLYLWNWFKFQALFPTTGFGVTTKVLLLFECNFQLEVNFPHNYMKIKAKNPLCNGQDSDE
jgi:hypothetical protein